MQKPATNYAFIDSQNINLGVQGLGWRLDWRTFRAYLRRRHGVGKAYLFIGYQKKNHGLYAALQSDGYDLVFKEVTYDRAGKPKGNVDAELVLQAAAIDFVNYDKAVIVSSDGDFACLVRFLAAKGKLRTVLSPSAKKASALLKRAAGSQFDTLEPLRKQLKL